MTNGQKLAIVLDAFEHSWPILAHNIEALRKELGSDDLVVSVIFQAVEAMSMRDAGLLPQPAYLHQ